MKNIDCAIVGLQGIKKLLVPILAASGQAEKINQQDIKDLSEHFDLAVEALKKQRPDDPLYLRSDKAAKIGNITFKAGVTLYKCRCGSFVEYQDKFCRDCGQSQKWEGPECDECRDCSGECSLFNCGAYSGK